MRNNKHLPGNFTEIKNGAVTIFARARYREALMNLDRKLFDFARHNGEAGNDSDLVGRGHCLTVALDGMDGRIVIRRYRHGGFLGALVGDMFWNHARPLNELLVSEKALEMGLMTTRVVAVIEHNTLFPFFKAEMVTEEIEGAVDLIQYIKDNRLTDVELHKKKRNIISEVAIAVRKMHKTGIYHGDLHLKNILLKEEHNGKVGIYIIDFDKSTLHKSLNITQRMKNLYRLDRSVEKLEMLLKRQHDTSSFSISRTDRVRFFREYMRDDSENNEEWRQLIKSGFSNYKLHKLRWYISMR